MHDHDVEIRQEAAREGAISVPPPQRGAIRVAVVQLAYLPAALRARGPRSPLEDPLFDLQKPSEPDTLLPKGMSAAPEPIRAELAELRRRIREAYVAQLLRRIRSVLESCRAFGARVVVLPEYSVPFELLEPIAKVAGEMVVVAGTHAVEKAAAKSGAYQRLGATNAPRLQEAVCPVLHAGRLVGLQAKLNPAVPERGFLKPGEAWDPIRRLPGDLPGPMGVLICLDFLHRESERYRTLVGSKVDECRFLAVPSLTPYASLPEFEATAMIDARRQDKKRPILYCNGSRDGGTTIYVDAPERPFPEGPGLLEREDEGVIVADVDFELVPRGRSTRYTEPEIVHPVAAASFVYTARPGDARYAAWLARVREAAGGAEQELDRLEAVAARVHEAEALLHDAGRSGIRKARLRQLVDEVDETANLERIRQLTREIVLPSGALSLPALRAALSLGAADVVRSWLDRFGPEVHELGEVEKRLRHESGIPAWSGPEALTAGGRRAFEDVVQAVRGGARPARSREVLASLVEAYSGAAKQGFERSQAAAERAIEAGKLEEARTIFQEMLAGAEAVLAKEPDDADMRRWAARCQLNVAACCLNLQEVEDAAVLLRRIDPGLLSPEGRCTLAEALAYTGDLDGAKAALPADEPGLAEEAKARLREVRQILALRAGEVPPDLSPESAVQREAAELLLERDDLDGAAQHALTALDHARGSIRTLTRAGALSILIAALERSVYEMPPTAKPIALDRRQVVVAAIERELPELPSSELPEAPRREFEQWRARYFALSFDSEHLQLILAQAEAAPDSSPPPSADARKLAGRLAREGKLDDAIRALPSDDHPWLGRWNEVELALMAGRRDRALTDVLELSRDVPGKAPVEHRAAVLLHEERRSEEALQHAQAAFDALPARGQRLLLAQCLLDAGRADTAWPLLEPLRGERDPKVLVLRAQVADLAAPREAPALWTSYLERRPTDGLAKVRRAEALYKIGERARASDVAWDALRAHGDSLPAHAIFTCASLQVIQAELGEQRAERAQEAAALLQRRFPGDPQAELFRFQLLAPIQGVVEAAPIDYALLERAGLVEALPVEEAVERLRRTLERDQQVHHFYLMGGLPFVNLCTATGEPIARRLVRLLGRVSFETAVLCAPVDFAEHPPVMPLAGAALLISELELYLLERLELLTRLREAIGGSGKLLVLTRARGRILQEHANMAGVASWDRLKRYERLAVLVATLPKAPRTAADGDTDTGDDELAAPPIPARALAVRLFDEGLITSEQLEKIQVDLPAEPAGSWPDPEPPRFGISVPLLEALANADAIEALMQAFPGRLLIDAEVEAHVHAERGRLAAEVEVTELADRVERFVERGLAEEGIVVVAPPHDVPELPPLRGPTTAADNALVLAPFRELLEIRALQHRRPEILRITGDFFGSSVLGHPDQLRRFVWPSEEHYLELSRWNRAAAMRDVHIPSLVRLLLPGPKGDEKLARLADLGFPDALDAEDLLRLERRYRGLAKTEPRRLLDRMEWIARSPGHLGAEPARFRLAGVYAEAIWGAFCGTERAANPEDRGPHLDDADAVALAEELLRRVERIDAETVAAMLDLLLFFTALQASTRPLASTQRMGAELIVDDESRAARLWRYLYDVWAPGNPARRGALGRAVRWALCALDEMRPEGPAPPEILPLTLVMRAQQRRGRAGLRVALEQAEIEAAAVLSANWMHKPLATVGFDLSSGEQGIAETVHLEEVLAYGAAVLGSSNEIHGDERFWRYRFPLRQLAGHLEVEVPVEAILLRAKDEVVRDVARAWAKFQGPHDGHAYRLLMAIADAPGDLGRRREYARRAARALWRLVRDDPAFLVRWPVWRGMGIVARRPDREDLLDILSEPAGPLPADRRIGDVLIERVQPGIGSTPPGVWAERLDVRALFLRASEVPGSLPAAPVGSKLTPEIFPREVEEALSRLDHPDEHPAARLAGDLYFLRVAAAREPIVRLPVGDVDLRSSLPDRLVRLLNHLLATPQAGTMAQLEGALLRVCRDVVVRLSSGSGSLLPRDRCWLTHRLFQWLCGQLQVIDPDARRAGMIRLAEQALAPVAPKPEDELLDPLHFDTELFDHRLATVLYALVAMEDLARYAGSGPDDAAEGAAAPQAPHAISSAGLEAKLVEIAERPRTGLRMSSVLDWDAPAEVPDLALTALLRRDPAGVLRLSAESRRRCIAGLPAAPEATTKVERDFAQMFVIAVADNAGGLSAAERTAFESWLRALDESPTSAKWRLIGLVSLFGPAAPHLEAEARSALLAHLDDSLAPLLASRYLAAIAALDSARLEQETEALLVPAAERGVGRVVFLGLARVAHHGPPDARAPARDLLARMAARGPFRHDAEVLDILRFMQIPEPTL